MSWYQPYQPVIREEDVALYWYFGLSEYIRRLEAERALLLWCLYG